MLHEIPNVRQERGPGSRRWFESDDLDVIVWLAPEGSVTGFQLCYDLGGGPHALTWRPAVGLVHSVINGGDDDPLFNRTPILEPGGAVPIPALVTLFEQKSTSLEPGLRTLILDKLCEAPKWMS